MAPLRNPCFLYVPKVGIWAKPLQTEEKNVLNVLTIVLSCLLLYLDHEKSSKSTISFNQTFIKTLAILRETRIFRVNYVFGFVQ